MEGKTPPVRDRVKGDNSYEYEERRLDLLVRLKDIFQTQTRPICPKEWGILAFQTFQMPFFRSLTSLKVCHTY